MIRRFITKAASAGAALSLLLILFNGCRQESPSLVTAEVVEPAESAPEKKSRAGPRELSFEDLNIDLKPDSVFEPWMLPLRIEELEGQRVRLRGFMCAAIFQLHNIHEFPLMREKECPYGPGGQAHHVAEVELRPGSTTEFTTDEICIEGIFKVEPYQGANGKTWSLYRLEDAAVCR
jgi:hypothetical protein